MRALYLIYDLRLVTLPFHCLINNAFIKVITVIPIELITI